MVISGGLRLPEVGWVPSSGSKISRIRARACRQNFPEVSASMPLITTRRLQERLSFIRRVGLGGVRAKVRSFFRGGETSTVEFRHPNFDQPISIRVPGTDFNVCRQWVDAASGGKRSSGCRLVIDAGANIGASSRMLASRFPNAIVLAVELEGSNYRMLERNVIDHPRIESIHAGLWSSNEPLLVRSGRDNENWSFHAEVESGDGDASTIPGITIEAILDDVRTRHGLERIDVLKMDIEGGELPVLADCVSWIDRVDAIMIELHEDLQPGSTAAFEAATKDFSRRWEEGELVCCAREAAAIRSP